MEKKVEEGKDKKKKYPQSSCLVGREPWYIWGKQLLHFLLKVTPCCLEIGMIVHCESNVPQFM